jgi:hypothetical protein
MVELNLDDVKKDASNFIHYETYVFIQTKTNIYNGRILQIDGDVFIFVDDKIPYPFPIRFDSLKAPIVPSTKKGVKNG